MNAAFLGKADHLPPALQPANRVSPETPERGGTPFLRMKNALKTIALIACLVLSACTPQYLCWQGGRMSPGSPATVTMLLTQPEMKDWFFCAAIVAFAIGFSYLIFLTIREERRAHFQMPQFPPWPALPVQRSLPFSNGGELVSPAGIQRNEAAPDQAAFELPEFLDLSPEEFAIYFDAYEKRRAALLGLKPGEPVPPLNSKAQRRIES
jgi:hypothetical protein